MKKQNLIVILAITLMASTLICFSSCFSCEGGEKESESLADRFTDEELNSFNPDAPYKMYGNSRSIDIQPRPYLHITAGRGAFQQDVNIRVTDVSERTMEQLDAQLTREERGELLFAFDIDAGLAPDEVIPGKYNVEFDLDKLGVPTELHPFLKVVRVASDGSIQTLNSHLQEGKLSYAASQNSVVALVFLTVLFWEGANMTLASWDAIKMNSNGHPWMTVLYPALEVARRLFFDKDDVVSIHVEDKFSNFNVIFRYSESERGENYKAYLEKSNRLVKLVGELKAEAEKKFNKKHPGWKSKWFVTDGDKAKQRMETAQIFYKLMMDNDEVKKLAKDDDLQYPQSILDIIKGMKMGNRFCREKLGMKPLSQEYDVYVGSSSILGKSTAAALRLAPSGGFAPHVSVYYDNLVLKDSVTKKLYYDPTKYDAVVVTMAHEGFHLYQSEHVFNNLLTDMRFFEATASVVEHRFGDWMKEHGYISYDPRSKEGGEKLGYSARDSHHLLGWTLDKSIPGISGVDDLNVDGGYMLGDLIEFLLEKKGDVSFPDMMNRYAYNKTLTQSLMDIFGISTKGQFSKFYEEFCQKHIEEIMKDRMGPANNASYHYITLPNLKHDADNCVLRIKGFGHQQAKVRAGDMPDYWTDCMQPNAQLGYPFAIKAFELHEWSLKDPKEKADGINALNLRYALFAVKSPKLSPSMMKFTFLDCSNNTAKYAPNNMYLNPCEKGYERKAGAALMFRPDINTVVLNDEDHWIDIVALYAPMTNLHVEGISNDRKGLLVDTKEEPTIALEKRGYVSGMQLCVVNNKTKKQKNFNVPLKLCGEKVKLPYKSLDITDKNKVDVTIRSRWFYRTEDGKTTYYGAASKPVHYTVNGKQVSQLVEEYPTAEPADAPEENVGEDGEEEGVLMEVTLRYPNAKQSEGRAKMVVTKDQFRIEIPSYSFTYFEKAPVAGMGDFPADLGENITKSGTSTVMEGKCKWYAYSADIHHVASHVGAKDDDTPALTDTYPVITEVTSLLPWTEKQKTYQAGGNHAGEKLADSKWGYKFQRDRQRELEAAGPVYFLSYGGFVKGEKMELEVAAEETYTSMYTENPRVKDMKKKLTFTILNIDRKN